MRIKPTSFYQAIKVILFYGYAADDGLHVVIFQINFLALHFLKEYHLQLVWFLQQ